jgi:hypothetical protein
VLGGQLADMTFTDPPYNVDYGSSPVDEVERLVRHYHRYDDLIWNSPMWLFLMAVGNTRRAGIEVAG